MAFTRTVVALSFVSDISNREAYFALNKSVYTTPDDINLETVGLAVTEYELLWSGCVEKALENVTRQLRIERLPMKRTQPLGLTLLSVTLDTERIHVAQGVFPAVGQRLLVVQLRRGIVQTDTARFICAFVVLPTEDRLSLLSREGAPLRTAELQAQTLAYLRCRLTSVDELPIGGQPDVLDGGLTYCR